MLSVKTRGIFASVLLLLLCGCQSLTLHITAQGIEPEKLKKLKQSLSEISDDVIVTELSIPPEFPNTVIAANPGYRGYENLAHIRDILWEHQFGDATELRFAQGNHFYLDGNIGVYLRNPSLQGVPNIPPYLRTQYCEFADATLMFNKDNSFELEYEDMDNIMGDLLTSKGVWQFNGKQITLFTTQGIQLQHYVLSKQEKETQWGPKPADVYIPQSTSEITPLNCEFLIIYVQ